MIIERQNAKRQSQIEDLGITDVEFHGADKKAKSKRQKAIQWGIIYSHLQKKDIAETKLSGHSNDRFRLVQKTGRSFDRAISIYRHEKNDAVQHTDYFTRIK